MSGYIAVHDFQAAVFGGDIQQDIVVDIETGVGEFIPVNFSLRLETDYPAFKMLHHGIGGQGIADLNEGRFLHVVQLIGILQIHIAGFQIDGFGQRLRKTVEELILLLDSDKVAYDHLAFHISLIDTGFHACDGNPVMTGETGFCHGTDQTFLIAEILPGINGFIGDDLLVTGAYMHDQPCEQGTHKTLQQTLGEVSLHILLVLEDGVLELLVQLHMLLIVHISQFLLQGFLRCEMGDGVICQEIHDILAFLPVLLDIPHLGNEDKTFDFGKELPVLDINFLDSCLIFVFP